MLRRSICALLLAAPLSLSLVGCASFGMKQNLAARRLESATTSHTARLMNLAARYEQQGNLEGALRLYQQVAKAEPANRKAQERIAALDSHRHNGVAPERQTMVAEATPAPATPVTSTSPTSEPVAAPPTEIDAVATETATPADPNPFPAAIDVVIAPEPAPAPSPMETAESAAPEPFEPPVFTVAETPAAPELSAEWWGGEAEGSEFESPFEEASPGTEESPADWSRTSVAHLCDGASPELQVVIHELDLEDTSDRKQALVNLARQGAAAQAALPAIEALLGDPDVVVQAHAAWTVWEVAHDPEDSIDPLMVLLVEDHNPEIVQISAYLLGAIGPDAAVAEDALWYTCDHTSGITRLHAVEALARICPDEARPVEILIEALKDEQLETRWLAAMALSSTGPQYRDEVISALSAALEDSAPEVCAAAALSLGGFGDQSASAQAQLSTAAASEDEDVRTAAQMALDCIVQ